MLKAFWPGSNPMAQILRQADTLQLTSDQADSIAVLNRWFTIARFHLEPGLEVSCALPDKYDQDEAYARFAPRARVSVDALIKIAPNVRSLSRMRSSACSPHPCRPPRPAIWHRFLGTAGTGLGMIWRVGHGDAAGRWRRRTDASSVGDAVKSAYRYYIHSTHYA